jgi:hypothetical protein
MDEDEDESDSDDDWRAQQLWFMAWQQDDVDIVNKMQCLLFPKSNDKNPSLKALFFLIYTFI